MHQMVNHYRYAYFSFPTLSNSVCKITLSFFKCAKLNTLIKSSHAEYFGKIIWLWIFFLNSLFQLFENANRWLKLLSDGGRGVSSYSYTSEPSRALQGNIQWDPDLLKLWGSDFYDTESRFLLSRNYAKLHQETANLFVGLIIYNWKAKLSCNRPWRPVGLWDIEAPTFSRQLADRWWWGCLPYVPAAPLPPGRFLVLISVRSWVDPRAVVWLQGFDKIIYLYKC
jgi:hypothetical protein